MDQNTEKTVTKEEGRDGYDDASPYTHGVLVLV